MDTHLKVVILQQKYYGASKMNRFILSTSSDTCVQLHAPYIYSIMMRLVFG